MPEPLAFARSQRDGAARHDGSLTSASHREWASGFGEAPLHFAGGSRWGVCSSLDLGYFDLGRGEGISHVELYVAGGNGVGESVEHGVGQYEERCDCEHD